MHTARTILELKPLTTPPSCLKVPMSWVDLATGGCAKADLLVDTPTTHAFDSRECRPLFSHAEPCAAVLDWVDPQQQLQVVVVIS